MIPIVPTVQSTESTSAQSSSMPILAAIDVGTNSVHMAIVRINPQVPSFVIIAREKATVRLGEYCNKTGALTPQAMQRAYDALERFTAVAHSHQAESIIAVATSAVREAPNGHDLLHKVQTGLGLTIDLISGQEEARRIYLGVLSAMDLKGLPHVVVDIGGGSTELIVGDGREPSFLRSIKVGAVRLTQEFLKSDPPTAQQVRTLRDYIRGMIEAPVEQIKRMLGSQPVQLIGTSGTIETLIAMEYRDRLDLGRTHAHDLNYETVESFVNKVKTLSLAERLKIPGLVERRAEIIIAGAIILQEIMRLLPAAQITFCSRSLREGLVVDWMLTQGLIEDRLRFQSSVRERHAYKLAHKYQVELAYSEKVADFAMSLFDQTQGVLHHWGEQERTYLWVAALLHNCGHFVSYSSHHKHSYYLIRHGELLGFNEEEVEVIANLARYHRKSPPKKKHDTFQRLATEAYRQLVCELSPLLRLATALDRRRIRAIKQLRCQFTPSSTRHQNLYLYLQSSDPDDDCSLELWSLNQKKEVFESQFNLTLQPCLEVGVTKGNGSGTPDHQFSPWLSTLMAQIPSTHAASNPSWSSSLETGYQ